jgi:hypothetical protein
LGDIVASNNEAYIMAFGLKSQKTRPVLSIICDDVSYTGGQLSDYVRASRPDDTISFKTAVIVAGMSNAAISRMLGWPTANFETTEAEEVSFAAIGAKLGHVILPNEDLLVWEVSGLKAIRTASKLCVAANNALFQPADNRENQKMQDAAKSKQKTGAPALEYFCRRPGDTVALYLGIHKNISFIYFDHKLADGLSTIQRILASAPVFAANGIKGSESFIKGCKSRPWGPLEAKLDYADACPRAFYKGIRWTFGGLQVHKKTVILDLLSKFGSGREGR